MIINSLVAATLTTLLLCSTGSAQSAADLLQKGIYAQETAGDLDSAIRIFRQVANSAAANKSVAAQAQYQLVLCMLQRGDRLGATKEVDILARSFPDQPDLVNKARKLLPGGSTVLAAPWGDSECSQLNIKRDGIATGEYLTYTVDPNSNNWLNRPSPNAQVLRWELTTQRSRRSVLILADRTTGKAEGRAVLSSNDDVGDPAAEPIAGPAIDIQQTVFAMRRMPLAVGYKTTLTTLPLTLSHLLPKEVELTVAGIEPVEVIAGKFKCYKVTFATLGQTFWIGVEGARPLVKIKSGNTEAELMKVWGPENFIETELGFFKDAGWKFETDIPNNPGPLINGRVYNNTEPGDAHQTVFITARKLYTAAAEIPQALRASLPDSPNSKCRPETIQTRLIGGQQSISCIVGTEQQSYKIWIRTGSAALELSFNSSSNVAVSRWMIDRALAVAKRIP